MQTINLTPILQAVIALLAALITYRLIPWIKSKTTTEQQVQLRAAVRVAVFAAEQIYGAGNGAEKMDYALKWLREQGYEIDSREVEAAVGECINALGFQVENISKQDGTENEPEYPDNEEHY